MFWIQLRLLTQCYSLLLNRTKVECAGLCLTFDVCYAFRFVIINEHDFNCKLYEKQGVCQTKDEPFQEIYASFQDPPPNCQGIQNSATKYVLHEYDIKYEIDNNFIIL